MEKKTLRHSHNSKVYDNFLVHWKYVKREKITGAKKGENKWKYFYKDDVADNTTTEYKNVAVKPTLVDKVKNKIDDIIGKDEKYEYAKARNAAARAKSAKEGAEATVKAIESIHKVVVNDKNEKAEAVSAAKKKESSLNIAYNHASSYAGKQLIKRELEKATAARIEAESVYDVVAKDEEAVREQLENARQEYNVAEYEEVLANQEEAETKAAYEDSILYKYTEFKEDASDFINNGKDVINGLLDKIGDEISESSDEIKQKVVEFLTPESVKAKRAEEEAARLAAEEAARLAEEQARLEAEEAARLAKLAEEEERLQNPLPELPLKDELASYEDDMVEINENYDPYNIATSWNCAYCTLAYDLRRRGYDVEAAEMESEDGIESTLRRYYDPPTGLSENYDDWVEDRIHQVYNKPGAKPMSYGEEDEYVTNREEAVLKLSDELTTYGEGSRGYLRLGWTDGGGHSIIWQVENGSVVYRDCQINEVIDINEYVARSRNVSYLRLDDLTPNKNILKRVKESD